MNQLEQQLTDHLRRRAAAVTPRYDLEAVELGIDHVEFDHRGDRSSRRPLIGALVGAAAAALVGVAVIATRDDPTTTSTVSSSPTTITDGPSNAGSGVMWPQSSVDEVREAQELADAGDPAYTWQVEPQLSSQEWWGYLKAGGQEIVERFLREELGWDHAIFNVFQGSTAEVDGEIRNVEYLRCAPNETNVMYPLPRAERQEAPSVEQCAPTIDDLHYQTVSLDLSQLALQGPFGIWVVSRWAPATPFAQTDPNIAEPATTARLEEFLAARIAGEGAEGFVPGSSRVANDEGPLLYATTSGVPYERYEIDHVSGPWWPYAEMEFTVRLFADGGDTVVEQPIAWRDVGGAQLTFVLDARRTMENGQPVNVVYEFFDGELTVSASPSWEVSWTHAVALTLGDQRVERIEFMGDPLPIATGCNKGPAATGANALAEAIQSDSDFDVTTPVVVSVGGLQGLEMDITSAPGASICERPDSPVVVAPAEEFVDGLYLQQGTRMRLYLVDLPEGSRTRVMVIAIVASEARFEDVAAAAASVIESIKFHPQGS